MVHKDTSKEDLEKKVKRLIIKSHNCRLVLYLKYENLSYKISTIQVLVIIASTIITFFETLKKQMHINNRDLRVISISLSTFIAMSLSIARYLKMEETKENIFKLLQQFALVEKELKLFKCTLSTYDESDKKRIFENYNESFTHFNTILTYNENIYYRRQILNMNFEDKINDLYESKIESVNTLTIDNLNRYQRIECIDNCLRNLFGPACCFVHRYSYNEFFKEYDYDASNNKLVPNHTPTICEKCCGICLSKCNNCLDSYMENENDIEAPQAQSEQEQKQEEEQEEEQEQEQEQADTVNEGDDEETIRCDITDIVCFNGYETNQT